MDKNEIAIYAVIAVVIIAAVAFLLRGSFAQSYGVSVRLSQSATSAHLYPYQSTEYVINITNTGNNRINDLLVGFYLNGQELSANTISIPAGQSVQLIRNYTYLGPGRYGFQAVADPGGVLDIRDRNATSSSVSVNVSTPETPNVYSSIPNNNIRSTQSFTFDGTGGLGISTIAGRYDITLLDEMLGPSNQIMGKVFENVYPYTANAYGAYAQYSNGSEAYAAWIQGTLTPQMVRIVVSSFGKRFSYSGYGMNYSRISNTTSICTGYSNGWTKVYSYYNATNPGTCATMAESTYVPYESNILVNAASDNALRHYQSGLFYTNSIILGSSLGYSSGNLSATNIFEIDYGMFISTITKLSSTRNTLAFSNSTCYGLSYSENGVNVCSYVLQPVGIVNSTLPYGLVNSTYLASNYSINMYSLVNNTQLLAAHYNAANLFGRLGVNESSVKWGLAFKNSCMFSNSSIGCKYVNFTINNTAYINLTNRNTNPIRINTLGCMISPGFPNESINMTVGPGSSIKLAEPCSLLEVPITAAQYDFTLLLNYTYLNQTHVAAGVLNVTNPGYV